MQQLWSFSLANKYLSPNYPCQDVGILVVYFMQYKNFLLHVLDYTCFVYTELRGLNQQICQSTDDFKKLCYDDLQLRIESEQCKNYQYDSSE